MKCPLGSVEGHRDFHPHISGRGGRENGGGLSHTHLRHGITHHEGAIRSAAVAPRLRELIWRLDRLDPADSTSVGEIGAEAARVMEGEQGGWRAVSAARKLQAV